MNELNSGASSTKADATIGQELAENMQGAETLGVDPTGTELLAEDPEAFKGWQRKTTLFLSGQAISFFGSMLVQFAIIWHVTLSTESGWMLALATAFGF